MNISNKEEKDYFTEINQKDEEIKNLEIAYKKEINIKKKYENEIKKLNEKMKEFSKNNNGQFIISSEFNSLWNNLSVELSLFEDYYEYPNILYHLIHELFCILENNINEKIEYIKESFIEVLCPGNEKINIKDLNEILKSLIRQNIKKIFLEGKENNDIEFSLIKNNYLNFFMVHICNYNDNNLYKNFFNIISNERFPILIKIIKTILIYTKYNDTDLKLEIKETSNRNITIKQFDKTEKVISINSKNINEKINGIFLLKPPFLKNGFNLSNSIYPIILEIKNNKLKTLKEEIEEYNHKIQKKIHNEFKSKHNSKLKLIFKSNIFQLSKKTLNETQRNKINKTTTERNLSSNYFFTHSNQSFKGIILNNTLSQRESKRPQSHLKYKKKKTFLINEPEFKNEIQKNKSYFLSKHIFQDLMKLDKNTIKIKLTKNPFVLKNLKSEKENLRNKRINNNSISETTVTYDNSSNNTLKKNCNVIHTCPQKKYIFDGNSKNYLFQNSSRKKFNKIFSFRKSFNNNCNYINNIYVNKLNIKSLIDIQIKTFANLTNKNNRTINSVKAICQK